MTERSTLLIFLLFTLNKIAISSEELFGDLMNCQTILIWLPYIHEWELCGRKRENVTERAKRERGGREREGVVERKGDRAGGRHKETDIPIEKGLERREGRGREQGRDDIIFTCRVTWGKAPPRGKAPLPSNYEFTYASGSIS